MSKGVALIADERRRQIEREGRTTDHDKQWVNGELALASACYAIPTNRRSWISGVISKGRCDLVSKLWPWALTWWKPTPDNRIRELAKAGALIAAEIDRLLAIKDEWRGRVSPCQITHGQTVNHTSDPYLLMVAAELARARAKFPSNEMLNLALIEEVGELAKAQLEKSRLGILDEAIQVACVAIRIAEEGDKTIDPWREQQGL